MAWIFRTIASMNPVIVSPSQNPGSGKRPPVVSSLSRAAVPAPEPSAPVMNGWSAPHFSHVRLLEDLRHRINTTTGTVLEQHQLYVDCASAADWLGYCSREDYEKGVGFDRDTLEWAAKLVRRYLAESQFDAQQLDVVSLGPGDGKNEDVLCRCLLEKVGLKKLNCYLLDINPSLVIEAYGRVSRSLAQYSEARVAWMVGDFLELNEYPQLVAGKKDVLRLFCMFGGTFGNLSKELKFVRHSLRALKPGDLFLVHVTLGSAPPSEVDRIQAEEPFFQHIGKEQIPPIEAWIRGPIDRYRTDLQTLRFDYSVKKKSSSNFASAYTITVDAIVNEMVRITMLEMHRYEMGDFTNTMVEEGFRAVGGQTYGYKNRRLIYLFAKQ